MLYVGTSFLSSLYHPDEHTEQPHARLDRLGEPLLLSAFNVFELENALRFAEFRKLITADTVRFSRESFQQDGKEGRWISIEISLPRS